MSDKNMIKTIAEHYGFDKQYVQFGEELGELMTAISKLRRLQAGTYYGKDSANKDFLIEDLKFNVVEESVDLKIMIDQLVYLTTQGSGINVQNYSGRKRKEKLKRQISRIKQEMKHNGKT